jgi:hypothetical protein
MIVSSGRLKGSPCPAQPSSAPNAKRRSASTSRRGHSREIAAQACGIAATTVYRWMKRGETEPDGPFGEFCMALKRADAEAEIASLRIISAAAESGVWQVLLAEQNRISR